VSGTAYVPAQGDLIWLALDPRTGREQSGDRPALVLSQRDFAAVTGYALIAPITSRVRGWPFEVALPEGAGISGVVLIDQTRSIDIAARRVRYVGRAGGTMLAESLARLHAIVAPEPQIRQTR
jgi:mRNA interferase MazF